MPYVTGTANSYSDLQTALENALTSNGWTKTGAVVHKGDAFVRLYATSSNNGTENPGLVCEIGTGQVGGVLQNPSPAKPRLGRPAITGQGQNSNITWPADYFIHILESPDEVWLILNHSSDAYWHLAFGVSEVPGLGGSGLWASGVAGRGGPSQSGAAQGSFAMDQNGSQNSALSTGLPFWQTSATNDNFSQSVLQSNINGGTWVTPTSGTLDAVRFTSPFFDQQPSAWNAEAILLPMCVYTQRPSSKVSLVIQPKHARYIRIDNYLPKDDIVLGSDVWRVYPGVRKNTVSRNGGSSSDGIDHSGTFGFAVRYDGA